jgi:hypothetical protein
VPKSGSIKIRIICYSNDAPDDPIAALLDCNVASIKAALPEFADLDGLEAAETENRDRKGVLEAIAHERLRRAAP